MPIHDEESPLLSDEPQADEFAKISRLPWRDRPSIYRIVPVLVLVHIAAYMIDIIRLNWALTLVCRNAYHLPLTDQDKRCQLDSIQSTASQYAALCSLVGGIVGLYMLPRISGWSDKTGRKVAFGLYLSGDLLAIALMSGLLYKWELGYKPLIAVYIISGLFGSNVLVNVAISSYVSDCVKPTERARAMSYAQACLLVGKASGPFLSSTLIRKFGTLQATFIAAFSVEVLAIITLLVLVPESLTQTDEPRDSRPERSLLSQFNILDPIGSIWNIAKAQTATTKSNILILVAIDLLYELVIALRSGIAKLYPQLKFNWSSIEIGYLQSATAMARIFLLVLIVPWVLYYLRKHFQESEDAHGVTRTELAVLRFGNMLEVIGYTGYGLSKTGTMFVISSFVATSGVIAKPTVQSALLNLVPRDRVGEFLGAKGVLDGLTAIAFNSIGLTIYSWTVKHWPVLVFYMAAAGYAIVVLISLRIKH